MKLQTLVALLGLTAAVKNQNDDEACCNKCPDGESKYYSIDKIFHHCGESCLNDKDYWKYKIFEPGLTKADAAD